MLTNIAKFEIRYQLKSPVFWITSAVFFWFAFSLINSDEIQFGWGGYVVRNSPYTTALTVMGADGLRGLHRHHVRRLGGVAGR
jgi:hypothetical protein